MTHHPSPGRVAILINPSSGKDEPILAPINRVLAEAGIEWEPFILKKDGEARAVEAALRSDPDALWIYGGDGTVAKVASALLDGPGADRPVGVLGGGTANALAETLGAPEGLEEMLGRLCGGHVDPQRFDVGLAGDRAFLLRATIGAMAGMTGRTTREEKDRLGLLAYALSSLRVLTDTPVRRFRLTVDGDDSSHDAISILVANADGTGLGAVLASDVREQDRRLDVFVVPDVAWVTRAMANAALGDGLMDGCTRLRGARITIDADEPVDVHLDGESIGQTPVTLTVRPSALTLLRYRSADVT